MAEEGTTSPDQWTDNYNYREDILINRAREYYQQARQSASFNLAEEELETIAQDDIRIEQQNTSQHHQPEPVFSSSVPVGSEISLDLITEVRKYPALWDHSCHDWKDTPMKKLLWGKLAIKLRFKDGMWAFIFHLVYHILYRGFVYI